jgi:hypothetical protein
MVFDGEDFSSFSSILVPVGIPHHGGGSGSRSLRARVGSFSDCLCNYSRRPGHLRRSHRTTRKRPLGGPLMIWSCSFPLCSLSTALTMGSSRISTSSQLFPLKSSRGTSTSLTGRCNDRSSNLSLSGPVSLRLTAY